MTETQQTHNQEAVLALDPGGTTGLAWAIFDCVEPEMLVSQSHQIGPQEHHFDLYKVLNNARRWVQLAEDAPRNVTFVTEAFEYRNRARAGLELISREYIGITKLSGQLNNIDVVIQSAAQAKAFVKDEHLKTLGLWSKKVEGRHAHDAWRHLLTYVINGGNPAFGKVRTYLLETAWK